jgi:hypothetical protein
LRSNASAVIVDRAPCVVAHGTGVFKRRPSSRRNTRATDRNPLVPARAGIELTNVEIDPLAHTDRRFWLIGADWIDAALALVA